MQMEPHDAAEKLRVILRVLGTFKSYYLEYKAKSALHVPHNPWRVQNGALFGRLDAFLARCQDVFELCNTVQEVFILPIAHMSANACDTFLQLILSFLCGL